MSVTPAPFSEWAKRLEGMDDPGRRQAAESAPYSPGAMMLHFFRRSRAELFNAPTRSWRWLVLAEHLLARQQAREPLGRTPDLAWLSARLLQERGACHMVQGHLQAAHAAYLAACHTFEDLGDVIFAARVKRGLLFTCTQMRRGHEAMRLGLEALAVFRRWQLKSERVSTMNNIGLVQFGLGRLGRADTIFSILRRSEIRDQSLCPYVFHNLLLVRIEQGRLEEAMVELGAFTRLCQASNNRLEAARGLFMMGECLLLQARPEEALEVLSDAKTELAALEARFDLALINIYIAHALTLCGRVEETSPLLRAAADFFLREGYAGALNKLLDEWIGVAGGAQGDVQLTSTEAFRFSRYFRHRLPVPLPTPSLPC